MLVTQAQKVAQSGESMATYALSFVNGGLGLTQLKHYKPSCSRGDKNSQASVPDSFSLYKDVTTPTRSTLILEKIHEKGGRAMSAQVIQGFCPVTYVKFLAMAYMAFFF